MGIRTCSNLLYLAGWIAFLSFVSTSLADASYKLRSVGANSYGQLGNGSTVDRLTPVLISDNVIFADGGDQHTLFIKSDNTLWGMGNNSYGYLGNGTYTPSSVPILIATNVKMASAGYDHSLFIKNDGSLWGMGSNANGQLTNEAPSTSTIPIHIADNVAKADAGIANSYYIDSGGILRGSGDNTYGQLGTGTTTSISSYTLIATNVSEVSSGLGFVAYLKNDGSLWGCGDNTYGQLGTGDTNARLAPVQIATGVRSFAVGDTHLLFIKDDGNLWGCGSNSWGQISSDMMPPMFRSSPVLIDTNVLSVTATRHATLFTKASGAVWVRGANFNGELADGSTNYRTDAVLVATDVNIIKAGSFHSLFLTAGDLGAAILPPGISTQPESITIHYGQTGILTVVGTGVPAPQYQWYFNDDPINGATSAELLIDSVGVEHHGKYHVIVTNAGGSLRSEYVYLTVTNAPQTITFPELPDLGYRSYPVLLTATASSQLPVIFTLVSGPATLNGNELTLTGTGTVTVRASQAGNSIYLAAPEVERSFIVEPGDATVVLDNLMATYDGTPHVVTATTYPESELAVTFTYNGSSTPPIDAGVYTVTATIEDSKYRGSANGTLTILKAIQNITFPAIADLTYTTSPLVLNVTASSGLDVSFSVTSGPASVAGNLLYLNGVGTVTVRATQTGNNNYSAAEPVDRSFTIISNILSWIGKHFTADELADSNISGFNADPDYDGLTNLLEYALDLKPKSTDITGLPEAGSSGTDWTYTYTRPAERPDLTYEVEMSTDLTNWTTVGVTHTMIADHGVTQVWQASVPIAFYAHVFYRLKVIQN